MREIVIEIVKKALKEEKLDLKYEEIDKLIEVPSDQELGDFAFPFLRYLQDLNKNLLKLHYK